MYKNKILSEENQKNLYKILIKNKINTVLIQIFKKNEK